MSLPPSHGRMKDGSGRRDTPVSQKTRDRSASQKTPDTPVSQKTRDRSVSPTESCPSSFVLRLARAKLDDQLFADIILDSRVGVVPGGQPDDPPLGRIGGDALQPVRR